MLGMGETTFIKKKKENNTPVVLTEVTEVFQLK